MGHLGTGEMAQKVKILAPKPDNLSSTPEAYIEKENQLLPCVL